MTCGQLDQRVAHFLDGALLSNSVSLLAGENPQVKNMLKATGMKWASVACLLGSMALNGTEDAVKAVLDTHVEEFDKQEVHIQTWADEKRPNMRRELSLSVANQWNVL